MMKTKLISYFLMTLVLPALGQIKRSDNWHQWRGPEANGVSRTANPPTTWSETKNIKWKIPLGGRGVSSPIVWGDRVFLLSSVNTGEVEPSLPKPEDQPERVFGIKHPNTKYSFVVICLDRNTGKEIWRRAATDLVPHEGHHKDNSYASASPFTDGKRLYCWFGSAGLYCFDLNGKKLWSRNLGKAKVGASLGEGCSPVVHDGKVVILRDNQGQSTIEALNAITGEPLWKKERDEPNGWATPLIVNYQGKAQVVTCGDNLIRSYDLENGSIIWQCGGLSQNTIPCPVTDGEHVYCMSGYQGYSLLALPLSAKGDITGSAKIVWSKSKNTPYIPSPILYDGMLGFLKSNQSLYSSLDTKTGKELMGATRLPSVANVYASPVGAGGRIYVTGRNGVTLVLKRGETFEVLATNKLDDEFRASAALVGRQMILRGSQFLYCIEEGVTTKSQKASSKPSAPDKSKSTRELLGEIAKREIPKDYPGGKGHQPFVDNWFKNAPPEKGGEVARLWKEQRRLFPEMKNRGASFIRILDYVRSGGKSGTGGKPGAKGSPDIKKKEEAQIRREPGKPIGKTGSVSGSVKNSSGEFMEGVMVSAFDDERRQSTSVFSQADGSFRIDGLHEASFRIRARLPGQRDKWIEKVELGEDAITISMESAVGKELEEQRPASSAFGQLKFESPRDRLNFKMMCAYCHQIGTLGFRSPEIPVDWETMIRRMDGFGGLYPHTKNTIVKRIIDTYKDDAVDRWPKYVPPPAPTGMVTKAKITAWEMGEPFKGSFHDLEVGDDGLAYVVHIGKQYTATLDPKTGERIYYRLPRGSHGPHSIEPDNDGEMWLTLCVSGEMAKFDLKTKEYTIISSAVSPAERGSWPHTLRIDPKDPEGYVWYTDAGRNSVFRLHPRTLERKEYHLLEAGQVKAGGKGESRGITPYGLDYSPVDGMIWYSKLNGNRIGRINPKSPDGEITEWNPPFRGPRRLHVAPDGMVWVPGFGSGVFGKFNPNTEKWTTYPLPDYLNQIPYALNVAPDGMVWICGTHNDTLYRFNPKTEYLVEFPLPFRVSYTREIEFDKDGNVWTSTSGPARHMENTCGTVIKLEILGDLDEEAGGVKLTPIKLSLEEQGVLSVEERVKQARNLKELFERIEARELPKAYPGGGPKHQPYVERVMAGLPKDQRDRVGTLFNQRRKLDPPPKNPGNLFIKILDFIAEENAPTPATTGPLAHRLESSRRSPFDAFVYVNRIPENPRKGEASRQYAGRIHGRLANQEGRVLLKLPPGMDRAAYDGFKTFLGSEGDAKVTNCSACHSSPGFTIPGGASLRDQKWTAAGFEKILRGKMKRAASGDANYAGLKISESDLPNLISFQKSLGAVSDEDFRELILKAEVVDVTASVKPKIATGGLKLTGKVRFEGPRPKQGSLPLDAASRKLYKGKPALDESILISNSGGLANVFVYVKSPVRGDFPMPKTPAVIDQQKSIFRPRVQGLRVGQELVMKNGDPFIHNIRSLSRKNRPFNIAQPAGAPDRKKSFEAVEGPVTIKCDFHPWMTAHFWIMDHPFFGVTDTEGRFSIPDLPPGQYTIAAWHEVYGEQEVKVTVARNAAFETVFTFGPKKN